MLETLKNQLYEQIDLSIKEVEESERPSSEKLAAIIEIIQVGLNTLKTHITANPFQNDTQEIHFFKQVKPLFYAQRIYQVELFRIENDRPVGTQKILKNYYLQELEIRKFFFKKNKFLYDYYRLKMSELDNIFFLRKSDIPTILLTQVDEPNTTFSTSGGYIFSKFIAYEKICEGLILKINSLTSSFKETTMEKSKLTWTGDKVNIAELAYGLYYTGQINGGNCDISDIIEWLANSLNISMGSVHRKFIDIRRRKTISTTKFLDQMREAINSRIEDDNTYKPNKNMNASKPL